MAISKGIRYRLGNYFLNRKLKTLSREKHFFNLEEVSRIGVIFQENGNENFGHVKSFIKKMNSKGKEVVPVGFIDSSKIPDFFILRRDIHFFCNSDLNFYLKPKPHFIRQFIDTDFDLLVNLTTNKLFPVEYIMALSKARFKTGKFVDGPGMPDFSIDIKGNQSVEYLINNLIHYLSEINKEKKT